MGLFSFIGKAAKAVGGLIGGPVGGALKLGGGLLSHKGGATAHTSVKMQTIGQMGTQARGKVPMYGTPSFFPHGGVMAAPVPRQVYSSTPVMPGGGIATSQGIMAPGGGVPPTSFGGSRGTGTKRRSTKKRKAHTTKKRKSSGRKLKFGSPAWRAKYQKKRRRKS